MNLDRIEGQWKQINAHIKHIFGRMINDQFMIMESRRDHQEGASQEAYGLSRDEAPKRYAKWLALQKEKTN